MEMFTGKEMLESFGALASSLSRLEQICRRARLPKWRRVLIYRLEAAIAALERHA
jgi:uncharacterized protein (UPF0147 family)